MQFDLLHLTGGDIAVLTVLTSLAAAFIAFVSSLTVAIVNGRYARKNARDAERRHYRIKRISPLLDFTAQRVAEFTRLRALIAREELDEARTLLDQMNQFTWLQFSSALGVAFADSDLNDLAERFGGVDKDCRLAAHKAMRADAGDAERQALAIAHLDVALIADLLHDVADTVIFNANPWKRRYYRLQKWYRRRPDATGR